MNWVSGMCSKLLSSLSQLLKPLLLVVCTTEFSMEALDAALLLACLGCIKMGHVLFACENSTSFEVKHVNFSDRRSWFYR